MELIPDCETVSNIKKRTKFINHNAERKNGRLTTIKLPFVSENDFKNEFPICGYFTFDFTDYSTFFPFN